MVKAVSSAKAITSQYSIRAAYKDFVYPGLEAKKCNPEQLFPFVLMRHADTDIDRKLATAIEGQTDKTAIPQADDVVFGQEEVLSPIGQGIACNAGNSFFSRFLSQGRAIPQHIKFITSERTRTIMTAEEFKHGYADAYKRNAEYRDRELHESLPTIEFSLETDDRLNSPNCGSFKGHSKIETYLHYAEQYFAKSEFQKLIQKLLKDNDIEIDKDSKFQSLEKAARNEGKQREFGRYLFRILYLRGINLVKPDFEERIFAESMPRVANRYIQCIVENIEKAKSESCYPIFVGHSHGVLAVLMGLNGLTAKDLLLDPKVPKAQPYEFVLVN